MSSKQELKEIQHFTYGQWDITLNAHRLYMTEGCEDYICSIECVGTWRCVNGMLYAIYEPVCSFDAPMLLTRKCRDYILQRARKAIKLAWILEEERLYGSHR